MSTRLIMILLIITAIGTLTWRFTSDGTPSRAAAKPEAASDRAGSTQPAGQHATVTWRGMQVEVPHGWRQLQVGDDHAVWGSHDRAQTVTVGSTPASSLPLAEVVDGARDELASSLPDVAGMQVSSQHGGTQLALSFTAGTGDTRMHVRQLWRRDHERAVDMIATWTSAEGAARLSHAQAPAPA